MLHAGAATRWCPRELVRFIGDTLRTTLGKPWENHRKMLVSWDLKKIMGFTQPGNDCDTAIENGPVEIVSFPSKKGDFP